MRFYTINKSETAIYHELFETNRSIVFLQSFFATNVRWILLVHCPKTNLNLCIQTEPAWAGADATLCLRLLLIFTFYSLYLYLAQKPDIYGYVRNTVYSTSAPSAFMWTVYKFPKSCRYYCIVYTVYLPSAWITFTNCSLFLPAANLFYSLWKCINFLYNLNFQPYCISHLEKVKYFRLFFYWTFNFFFCFTGFISLKDRT